MSVYEDVLSLDISMDYISVVEVEESFSDHKEELFGLVLGQSVFLL